MHFFFLVTNRKEGNQLLRLCVGSKKIQALSPAKIIFTYIEKIHMEPQNKIKKEQSV